MRFKKDITNEKNKHFTLRFDFDISSCAQEKTVNKIKSEEVIFYKIDDNGEEVRQNPAMNELVAYDVDGKLTKVYVTYY